MRACAVWCLLCELYIVMSSAYVRMCTSGGGEGMSEVYMLKRVGERTDPCGTPYLAVCVFDLVLLYVVNAWRPWR